MGLSKIGNFESANLAYGAGKERKIPNPSAVSHSVSPLQIIAATCPGGKRVRNQRPHKRNRQPHLLGEPQTPLKWTRSTRRLNRIEAALSVTPMRLINNVTTACLLVGQ